MLFRWFDDKQARQFGLHLANFYMARSPLGEDVKTSKATAKKHAELYDKMGRQIDQFKSSHRLNIYKKARLGNAFKWALRDAGYQADDIDQLTSWIMIRF